MFTRTKEQRLKLDTYLVVMASHELDPDEPHPVPNDTQVLEMPYPADITVDKAFLEKNLSGWLENGYFIQSFSKRDISENFEF